MRAVIASLCAMVHLASPVFANVPETSPVPLMRPAGLAALAAEGPRPDDVAALALPRPRPRPDLARVAAAAMPTAGLARSPIPKARPVAAPPDGMVRLLPALAHLAPPLRPMRPPARAQAAPKAGQDTTMPGPRRGDAVPLRGAVCGIAAIKGERIAPILSPIKGCGLADGVRITAVAGVALSRPATVDCETAVALNTWTERVLAPSVGIRGGGLAGIDVLDSYACRPRNNVRGNRISEHGTGRAVDIGGFTLADGSRLSVLDGWGSMRNGPLMKAVFRGACGLFGTALGPAANSFHRNHFHFDTARYRAGSYCE